MRRKLKPAELQRLLFIKRNPGKVLLTPAEDQVLDYLNLTGLISPKNRVMNWPYSVTITDAGEKYLLSIQLKKKGKRVKA